MRTANDLSHGGLEAFIAYQASQEGYSLIESRGVAKIAWVESLLGNAEPFHDQFSKMLRNVPEHPAIFGEVVEFS
jgi:hypothetical protein